MTSSEDSLKKRYLVKLLSNTIGLFVSLITQSIIPRALGPVAYGNFHFLSNFFQEVVSFFELGSSTAFYTKLSARLEEKKLITFYVYLALLIILIILLFVTSSITIGLGTYFWPDQLAIFIYAGAIWGLASWGIQVLNKIADAFGLTVDVEKVRIAQRGLSLILILGMFLTKSFSLGNFFFYHYFIFAFLGFALLYIFKKHHLTLSKTWILTRQEISTYLFEFYHYCHPLVVNSLIALITGIFDRWMLQKIGGSVEQGFFGLSYQIGAICFLFTGAITPLIMREFSKAFSEANFTVMRALFNRYVPMLYSIAAYFSVFISIQADKTGLLIGGKQFQGAIVAIAIMVFYPIHQTYGQLFTSLFMATGHTRIIRNMGVIYLVLGIPMTYFLLAPPEIFGLSLGSTGLAIKMVLLQIFVMNIFLWQNTKLLQLRFSKFFFHQFYSVGFLYLIAFLSAKAMDSLISNPIVSFFVSGFVYTLLVLVTAYTLPQIFWVSRSQIDTNVRIIFKFIAEKKKKLFR